MIQTLKSMTLSLSLLFTAAIPLNGWASAPGEASCLSASDLQAYRQRMKEAPNKTLRRQIDNLKCTPEERECLEFLYAYLPQADMADFTPEYWLANVRCALRAREEMPWGKDIPMREWKHFVLPVRVNNENLDMARPVFYEALAERVRGLSLREAILEVNHWCHEKVTYRPSDARTSSPLSAMSQAIGRCGEESTFAAAALRSVGIPARQVYTPRWAHTDDNHAWVEVWADGKWWFIGACEPEPVLNLAWFNAPAARGMLMNTNVFGVYDGPEEVLRSQPLSTRINITSNYAPVQQATVKIVDSEGRAVKDAEVRFCLYNYAEYFPIAVRTTGQDGTASITSGCGDLVAWASHDGKFAVGKVSASADGVMTLKLEYDGLSNASIDMDIVPPAAKANVPEVTAAMREENNRRFAQEDSIRNAYTATFPSEEECVAVARQLNVDADTLTPLLTLSRGNHSTLVKALQRLTPAQRKGAMLLLQSVSEKDLRDIPEEVIMDHVLSFGGRDRYEDMTVEESLYTLCPRVENEGLTAWRAPLTKAMTREMGKKRGDMPALIEWVKRNVKVADDGMNFAMSPMKVYERRECNARSRNIFFVAAARSLGAEARIDPVTGQTQWRAAGKGDAEMWRNVVFETQAPAQEIPQTGTLRLDFTPTRYIIDPKYYTSFSLSKIEDGKARLMEYPEDATWSKTFSEDVILEEGQYALTSGQRLADGSVLAHTEIFTVAPGEKKTVPLTIRNNEQALSVIGNVNAENLYTRLDNGVTESLLATAGRGYYVIACIQPNHEPSAHLINDIAAVSEQLEATGRHLILLFEDADHASRFRRELFPALPSTLHFGIDKDGTTRREIEASLHMDGAEMPLVVVADSFNRIVSASSGYSIALGERMLQILRQVAE